ncbi:MAG: UDP-3-O-(3-hydroxymyristoyl)glucosamine N-acyltransferase, partial [Pseudomonadales bacterium]
LRGDSSVEVNGIADLLGARSGQLTFLFNSAWRSSLKETQASAVILRAEDAPDCPIPLLISPQPRLIWARVARVFDPLPAGSGRIHPSAVISDKATIGDQVSIDANVVVEDYAQIEADTVIGAGSFIGQHSRVGEGSRLFANVTLYHDVTIGKRAIIHSGAVIGADGFGFEFDGQTGILVKIPQVYGVRIGDDVEIGAGSTIDRGALNHTEVANGVKLDNQVQVGHGTRIGAHTAISGCTAIAGSTRIGSYCLIGGAVGIIDNIEITDQVEITAKTLVSRSITEKGRYSSGTGLMPSREWKRSIVGFRKLDDLIRRVRKLEKR